MIFRRERGNKKMSSVRHAIDQYKKYNAMQSKHHDLPRKQTLKSQETR